ncbi:hypothetical protein F0562_014535 [Nyssa sinensis]|uniref:Beta-glucosidase n=1 Tax=Nyssa sinensis TaxID=561372 RepID=A0A5J4ZQJ7_9ASTE|nr:hypothetical protein F0562_014535 [Nyssa sinensis]
MAFRSLLFLTVILLIHPAARSDDDLPSDAELAAFNRTSFPSDFLFGASSSAFQYEGAANVRDKIADHSNASKADEFYKLHQDDVSRIKNIGLDAFRISISWSRLIRYKNDTPVLRKRGLEYYNNLINGLLNTSDGQRRVEPFVTLFHWDTPQFLEEKYGGFLNESIVNDYVEYVNFCFKNFGDRVKHWITFNEPHNFVGMGYATGQLAPAAVKLYRNNYTDSQKGKIGIVLNVDWLIPYDKNNASDRQAVDRAFAFHYGWFMQPIYNGSYPAILALTLQSREMAQILVQRVVLAGSMFTHGEFRELLLFTKNKYNNPEIYITENGFSTCNYRDINDTRRTAYHYHHLKYIKSVLPDVDRVEPAKEKNKNVKGYLLWSLLDDFEWNSGYTVEFGIIHVNYTEDSLDRKYKHSAKWYKDFLNPMLKEIGSPK